MEVVNDLLNYSNMKIIQNSEWFSFSLDSVLLPNFVTLNKKCTNIIDFCTGNAPIPLILSTKTNANIVGVELQKDIYNMACKSVKINNLENRIKIINEDVKNLSNLYPTEYFDIITCNPPYFKVEKNSNLNKNDIKCVARHEMFLNLDDIFKTARKILKNNGIIALVHRPDRLLEIVDKMRDYNIEPKKIQFVYPKKCKECNMILIEGKKNGNPGLKILEPIYVHEKNGDYRQEIRKLFG